MQKTCPVLNGGVRVSERVKGHVFDNMHVEQHFCQKLPEIEEAAWNYLKLSEPGSVRLSETTTDCQSHVAVSL